MPDNVAVNDIKIQRTNEKDGAGVLHPANLQSAHRLHRLYAAKLNVLRFVAICSIVWGHSLLGWETASFTGTGSYILQTVLIESGRLGTVIFFIISGYFLAGKIGRHSVTGYLRQRLHTIIIPWCIFLAICVCLQSLQLFSLSQLVSFPFKTTIPVITTILSSSIFYAAYWFIPVSIFSACVLILFKKYVHSIQFGALLAAITCFYCTNLYYGWIDVNHTKSFLGYTFFIWLGVWFKNNIVAVNAFLAKMRRPYLFFTFVVLFIASCWEGVLLRSLGCKDPFGSIRLSNILLSLVIFVIFLKSRSIYRIKKLRPEKYVYGVYLIHSIILLEVVPLAMHMLKAYNYLQNTSIFFCVQIIFSATIITLSYLLSVIIKKSRFHFLTGK